MNFDTYDEAVNFVHNNVHLKHITQLKYIAEFEHYDGAYFEPVQNIDEAREKYWELGEKLYRARGIVRDLDGKIVAEFHDPYESLTIDSYDFQAIHKIAEDYGISEERMIWLCKEYLHEYD